MHLQSLSIGRPAILIRAGRQLSSSINRKPVDAAVRLDTEGFEGDQVSDQSVHGGPDKAACVFPSEHYPRYSELLGHALAAPAFGENLTTVGLLESEVCIGDVYRVGAAFVQVSQPRAPCQKLAIKHGIPQIVEWVARSGMTGFYFRAREAGAIRAGDAFTLCDRPHPGFPIALLNQQRIAARPDRELLRAIAALPELGAGWRASIERRLADGHTPDAEYAPGTPGAQGSPELGDRPSSPDAPGSPE